MNTDTEQLMKRLHSSLCPDELEAEIRAKFKELEDEIERLGRLSVENIMLAVVPGYDGEGEEVYAESAADVESLLSDMGQRLEDYAAVASPIERTLQNLREYAIEHAADYPNITTANPWEQLYALVTTLEGTKAANEDLHKIIEQSKDTKLLDFLETEHFDNVFPLGKTWYSRLAYGQPYKKHSTLRSAIVTAMNNKELK